MPIDFTQIESGEDFELLCEDLLQAMGFTIEHRPARGRRAAKTSSLKGSQCCQWFSVLQWF